MDWKWNAERRKCGGWLRRESPRVPSQCQADQGSLAVNAPEEEQTNLVATLREKILHTVQGARNRNTPPSRAELKLRNVNMFLHALVSGDCRGKRQWLMSRVWMRP